MGGEKAANLRAVCGPRGSPPRGRGKVAVLQVAAVLMGITPAWAGKSLTTKAFVGISADHPRVGGEKLGMEAAPVLQEGSPPRGRGKGGRRGNRGRGAGITPAWAGKRTAFPCRCLRTWDHPRVGGEKPSFRQARSCRSGSPPRGRGKDRRRSGTVPPARITPAWAGKSNILEPSMGVGKDHPRVGGEKSIGFFPVFVE